MLQIDWMRSALPIERARPRCPASRAGHGRSAAERPGAACPRRRGLADLAGAVVAPVRVVPRAGTARYRRGASRRRNLPEARPTPLRQIEEDDTQQVARRGALRSRGHGCATGPFVSAYAVGGAPDAPRRPHPRDDHPRSGGSSGTGGQQMEHAFVVGDVGTGEVLAHAHGRLANLGGGARRSRRDVRGERADAGGDAERRRAGGGRSGRPTGRRTGRGARPGAPGRAGGGAGVARPRAARGGRFAAPADRFDCHAAMVRGEGDARVRPRPDMPRPSRGA